MASPRAYKDTFLNRNVLTQVALFQNHSSRRSPNIVYLSSTRLVKFGRAVHLAEVEQEMV